MGWGLVHETVVYALALVGAWHLAGVAFPGGGRQGRGRAVDGVRCGQIEERSESCATRDARRRSRERAA